MDKTIEQKARAYDKAIERANDILKGYNPKEGSKATINYIFPELAESEDERIRKVLIEGFKRYDDEFLFNGCLVKEILSWLEKQKDCIKLPNSVYTFNKDVIEFADKYSHTIWEKLMDKFKENENYSIGCNDVSDIVLNAIINAYNWFKKQSKQETTDKVKPKFHEGDWVVHDISDGRKVIRQIINMTNKSYILDGEDFNTFYFNDLENDYHLWTIQDAKDGDVLFAENFDNIGGCVFLFKGLDSWKFDAEGDRAIATGYCCTNITESGNTDFGIQGPDCVEIKRVHPATKEQRDLFFQKMKESGYEWDAEKKELKKIDNKPLDEFAGLTDFEKTLADICIGWIGEEPGWKQYIKDNADILLKIAVEKFNSVQDTPFWKSIYQSIMDDTVQENQLDSEQINWLKFTSRVQPKIGWSKEDENCLSTIIAEFSKCAGKSVSKDEWMCCNDFLNSLRDRVQSKQEWTKEDEKRFKSCLNILQPKTLLGNTETINTKWLKSLKQRHTWKPSDEQMQALSNAGNSFRPFEEGHKVLWSLYNDLKKLREDKL